MGVLSISSHDAVVCDMCELSFVESVLKAPAEPRTWIAFERFGGIRELCTMDPNRPQCVRTLASQRCILALCMYVMYVL